MAVIKGDIPVLIACHPGYSRPTCAGGREAASTRAVGIPVRACVCVCVYVCMRVCVHVCVRVCVRVIEQVMS